jgi:hypothetical protein
MAHSFLEFNRRMIRLSDTDILVSLLLMSEALAGSSDSGDVRVRDLVDGWLSQIDEWGPGCIELHLDRNIVPPLTPSVFVRALRISQSHAVTYGPEVPFAHANERLGVFHSKTTGGMSVSSIQEALSKIVALIQGE